MSTETPRYVGRARPDPGARGIPPPAPAPDPPGGATTDEHPDHAQRTAGPGVTPGPVLRPAPGHPPVTASAPTPVAVRGRARPLDRPPPPIRSHRQLLPRVVFERFELLAWIGVVAVLAVTSVFVIRAVGAERAQAELSVRFQPAPGTSPWPTAVTTGDAPCIFTNCTRAQLIGPPVRVRIAALGVDAGLEDLVLDGQGQLEPPKSYVLAGWFKDGVSPGDPGPAVIAGHVDSAAGPAVFYRLHELRAGDSIEVLRGDAWTTFRVTATEQYPKDQFPSERVYRPTPDAELRLITCGGDFDAGRYSYRDNIVVYAVIE